MTEFNEKLKDFNKRREQLKDFNKWILEGIRKGFLQDIDKQLRIQYGISETVSDEQWKEVERDFDLKG